MKTIKEQIQARIHCHATSKIAHLALPPVLIMLAEAPIGKSFNVMFLSPIKLSYILIMRFLKKSTTAAFISSGDLLLSM